MDLSVLFTSRGTEWYELGDRPTTVDGIPSKGTPSARSVYREITTGRYEAVITSLTGRATLLAVFAAARAKRIPVVLWVEIWEHPHTLAHRLSRPLARRLYRAADSIVAFGPHVADFVAQESGRTAGVFLATQAVDNIRFRDPVSSEELRHFRGHFGFDDSPIIAFAGRLENDKGIDDLIEASAMAVATHTLVIAGRGSLAERLAQRTRTLGVADRTRFVGHLSNRDLLRLLHASDALVLPSVPTDRSKECWGMVINEAMNCGTPVIASDAVGAAAGGLVVHGRTGLVVPARSPSSLATALQELLTHSEERDRLAGAARQHVLRWTHESAADGFVRALHHAWQQSSEPVQATSGFS
jgi:glycosyltransferase involved in cell wall biosynthesis